MLPGVIAGDHPALSGWSFRAIAVQLLTDDNSRADDSDAHWLRGGYATTASWR
jgi:hypothetical protein